jgi:hypothetical protein
LDIIKEVSLSPKDNYRTWYAFIKLLSYLPNEAVTEEVLNFIPVWLDGKYGSTLQAPIDDEPFA